MNKTLSKLGILCDDFPGLERVLAQLVTSVDSLSSINQHVTVCDQQKLFDFSRLGLNRLVGTPIEDAWSYLNPKPLKHPSSSNLEGNYMQAVFACGYGRVLNQIPWVDNPHPPLVKDVFTNINPAEVEFLVRTSVMRWTRQERISWIVPLVAKTDLDILVIKPPQKNGFSQLLEGLSLENHCRLLARPQWGVRDLYARLRVYESAGTAIGDLEKQFFHWQNGAALSQSSHIGRRWQHHSLVNTVQDVRIQMTWSQKQKYYGDVCLGVRDHYVIALRSLRSGDTIEFEYFADDPRCTLSAINATLESARTMVDTIALSGQQADWADKWFAAVPTVTTVSD